MNEKRTNSIQRNFALRDVQAGDVRFFFEHQLDPIANHMAAFTSRDPTDRDAHAAHWKRILGDKTVKKKTILLGRLVAGHIASFDRESKREVTYWVGTEHWGKGLASAALAAFLKHETKRPLYARAAADNAASIRVLEKNGFSICAEERGFANAREEEIDEYLFVLHAGSRV